MNSQKQQHLYIITDEEMEDYLKWLGVLVERINGSLVPDHPGKCSNPQFVLYFGVLGLTHLLTPNFFFIERKMVPCGLPSSATEVLRSFALSFGKPYGGQRT